MCMQKELDSGLSRAYPVMSGCSVQGLVALLEEQLPLKLPRSSFEVLPLPLWKLLWRLLIKCSWEVEFFR